MHPVPERELGDAFLKFLEVLGCGENGSKQKEQT
jgi:hypothetical protein